MTEIEPFGRYAATVKIRRGHLPVKPEAEWMDGQRLTFEALWQVDDLKAYIGEWAMLIDGDLPPESPRWIASGDLADVEPIIARREAA